MQTLLFERHPLPWTCDEKVGFGCYFVRDAKGAIVICETALDETTETHPNENEGLVSITTKRPRPGALALVRMIVALPALFDTLRGFMAQYDDNEGPPAEAYCFECTVGTVPNSLNKGPCPYHNAKAILARVNAL